ncbi:hypothetical protein [Natrinema caseinilyticum]|uniref:hypothetical protein n=1 Tax=Natrinema caseinilyticum TaxID=2961570 RepID=UPI0020C4ED6E|nr:hypothetical protein [Natrinema caseinilyticum]
MNHLGVAPRGTRPAPPIEGAQTLSDPTLHAESSGRRSLSFTTAGEEIGSVGVDGTVTSGIVDLQTEIWHREGTTAKSIKFRIWMPTSGTDSPAEVAVRSPVEGDSSSPPSVSLSTPRRDPGTTIEIDDLDDLADETISTLAFFVRPPSKTATTLLIDAAVDLTSSDLLGSEYSLEGRLRLEFPSLDGTSSLRR